MASNQTYIFNNFLYYPKIVVKNYGSLDRNYLKDRNENIALLDIK